MKKWLKISLISIASLMGLVMLIFATVCFVVFSPKQLTLLANKYVNEFVNADVSIERIKVSYFSIYPFMRLDIDNVLAL